MDENFTNTEKLIQYLDGEMTGDEAQLLGQQLESNPLLKEELENLQLAKDAVKTLGLKNKISTIHITMMKELNPAKAKPALVVTMAKYALRIAAAIIFIIASYTGYQYFSATPQKLFSENFNAFTLHQTRGDENTSLKSAYSNGDMAAVIKQFKTLANPSAEEYFLNANALLSLRQPAAAIQSLIALQQKNNSGNTHYFEDDAAYYLGLAYMANNGPAKAYPLLQKINSDKNNPYHSKVSKWMLLQLQHLSR